jgi:ATP-dependent Clp protease protease subunit
MSKKIQLPRASTLALPQGVSFDVPASALARWNSGVVAREDEERKTDNTISVYDPIGFDPWSGGGVTAKRIAAALRAIGKGEDVVVNINSPGGDVFEALAIYNLLRDHEGEVTTRVVGLAASAASVSALAGDRIETARAGFFMIHNAWIITMGNRNDLRDAADWVEQFDDALASIYAARTGKEKKDVAKMMDKETWLSGDAAIEGGFADALLPADLIEEKDEGDDDSPDAAVRQADILMARAGLPRAQRRALLNKIKDAGGPRAQQDEGTRDAALQATRDAGEAREVVKSMQDFLNNI